MISTKRYSYLLEGLSILAIVWTIGDFFIKWSFLLGTYAQAHANFFTRIMEQHYSSLPTSTLFAHKYPLNMLGVVLVDSISVLLLFLALLHFIKLLHLYRSSNSIFSATSIDRYKKVCWYVLLWTIYNPINATLTTLLITITNPPGQRVLEITLKSNDVTHACIVGFFYFIARMMQEALSIKNEIDLTI